MAEEKKEPEEPTKFDQELVEKLLAICHRFIEASGPEQSVLDTALIEFGLSEEELASVAFTLNPTIHYVKTQMKGRPEQLYIAGVVEGLLFGKVLQERKGGLQ